jgi:hypothetical protein
VYTTLSMIVSVSRAQGGPLRLPYAIRSGNLAVEYESETSSCFMNLTHPRESRFKTDPSETIYRVRGIKTGPCDGTYPIWGCH